MTKLLRTGLAALLFLTPVQANRVVNRGAAAPEPPWAPDSITGLTTWLRADAVNDPVNGQPIATASDLSGNANDGTQGTAGLQPTYVANAVNGKPAMSFNGTSQYLTSPNVVRNTVVGVVSIDSLLVNKTWSGALAPEAGQSEAFYFGTAGTSSTAQFRVGTGTGNTPSGASAGAASVVAGQFMIWVGTIEGTALKIYINSAVEGAGTAAATPKTVSGPTAVGAGYHNGGLVDYWPGDVAELLYYNSVLSTGDRHKLEDYLADYYGITNLPPFSHMGDALATAGAGDTAAGNLDTDAETDEFVVISPENHFKVLRWNGETFDSHDVISGAAVVAKLDRFGGDVRMADVDGDGDNDIVTMDTSNSGTTGSLVWYEHPGTWNGTWAEHTIDTFSGTGTGNEITHSEVIAGDINQDGRTDIVARDLNHGVWVWIQAAPGDGSTWNARNFTATNPREGLALWNPDGDGDLDILINGVWLETPADSVAGTYTVRTILGAEAWYPAGSSAAEIADYAAKVVVHDFNGDGREDFIITNAEELDGTAVGKPDGIQIFFQPADPIDGTWTSGTLTGSHFSWHNAELADYDGDGDLDFVTGISDVGVDTEPGKKVVFVNGGNGASWTETSIAAGRVYQISVGDADGDGDMDVLAPEHFAEGAVEFYKRRL